MYLFVSICIASLRVFDKDVKVLICFVSYMDRLVSLSKGERTVSLKAWDQAKTMEDERKSRLVDTHGRSVQPSVEP